MDLKATTHVCVSPVRAEQEEETQVHPPSPMFLITVHGGTTGAMLRIEGRETTLGRSLENVHQFPDPTVSRRHAVIVHDDGGLAWLTDLGSSNGTFLDGKRLAPLVAVRIEDGARLQLGVATVLKYVSLDPREESFQREMFERSVRDNLTGLYNRGYFMEQIAPLCERNRLRNLGTAVLMVDVDHFKRVNDAHGHDAGDAVLREVARTLRAATRGEDLVARYGGEEFVLAIPIATADQGWERGEQVRRQLAGRAIRAGRKELRVTASIGVSCGTPARPRTVKALITAADVALYEAKRGGRDRVVAAERMLADSERLTESREVLAV